MNSVSIINNSPLKGVVDDREDILISMNSEFPLTKGLKNNVSADLEIN